MSSSSPRPPAQRVRFKSLYAKETYQAVTVDGWTLTLTRYQPVLQPWEQPLFGVPIMLVHGFSQNRHAWTAGDFVKHLLMAGMDVHVCELRGHGKSSVKLQHQLERAGVRPRPDDIRYRWTFSDYFLRDAPAALQAVRMRTGWPSVAYCGHSMGGIIGYGLAAKRAELLSLTTIGSPLSLGAEAAWIRLASRFEPLVPAVSGAIAAVDRGRAGLNRLSKLASFGKLQVARRRLEPDMVPLDWILGGFYRSAAFATRGMPWRIPKTFRLFNPDRARLEDVEFVLRVGEEREPMGVLRTFLKWSRDNEIRCERSGFDIREGIRRIRLPLQIVYGDEDILAGHHSTRPAYERAQSAWLKWRRFPGNAHIDLTVGFVTEQICEDLAETVGHAMREADLGHLVARARDEALAEGRVAERPAEPEAEDSSMLRGLRARGGSR